MRRPKSSRAFGLLSVAISGAVLATTSPAVAQDDAGQDDSGVIDLEPVPHDQLVGPFKIDDGRYSGALAYSYSQTYGQGSVTLFMHRDGAGSATFEVKDEVMTGDWTLSDTGGLTILEHPGLAEADAVGSATGTLTGSFPYIFAGLYTSDVDATASAAAVGGPNISASDSDTGSVELSFELSESVQICGQVQANWDESFRNQFLELGWETHVKTQLVAFPETSQDEIQARVIDLVESATFVATHMSGPEPAIEFMLDALIQAESIMSDIDNYPQTCPVGDAFLRIINQIMRDMMNTLLDNWQDQDEGVGMIVLRRMAEVGLRAGVVGSGATDPQAAALLEEKILAITQERFDELVDTTFDEFDLRQTIIVAEMFGHQLAEVSNADLCLVLGGC